MTDKSSGKIVYFDEIPKGDRIHEYPSDTIFVLNDTKLERDPVTGRLKRE